MSAGVRLVLMLAAAVALSACGDPEAEAQARAEAQAAVAEREASEVFTPTAFGPRREGELKLHCLSPDCAIQAKGDNEPDRQRDKRCG